MGEKVCAFSPNNVLCLKPSFCNKKLFLKFYEKMLWQPSNRNPGGIKKKGIDVLNHKHTFPM
jgi:hypothetical protein